MTSLKVHAKFIKIYIYYRMSEKFKSQGEDQRKMSACQLTYFLNIV